jgi:hypothetical protein
MDRMTLDRIAMLCDEMLRRGVPLAVVQPVIDWLDEQTPPRLRGQLGRKKR